MVVQQAPESRSKNREAVAIKSCYLLPLSARSPEALQAVARSYLGFLASSELPLHDICYSASARRSHHDCRMSVAGDSSDQLIEGLEAFLKGETRAGLSSGRKALGAHKKLAFVFSGQGSQWFGMGRTLLHDEPIFREVIERCELALRPHTDWSLIAELAATDAAESRLNDVDVIQPALFAVQVALAALWRSWGIEPDAVVGHSMGEVAAAYVARRAQPRRRGADNLHAQQAGQAYRRARRDGRGRAVHRRRAARNRRLRRSRFNRGQHQSYIHGAVGRPDGARRRYSNSFRPATSSAGW